MAENVTVRGGMKAQRRKWKKLVRKSYTVVIKLNCTRIKLNCDENGRPFWREKMFTMINSEFIRCSRRELTK